MNWEVISNERSSLKEYRLIDQNNCVEVIKYNPLHQSVRLSTGNYHRLFFLEGAGSFSKTFFKNEYGMEIGSLVHDKFQPKKKGSVLIDSKRYQYQIQTNTSPELIIFENDSHQPVANCGLPANTSLQNSLSPNNQVIDNTCFLLGLCWYLFLPLVHGNSMELASAAL